MIAIPHFLPLGRIATKSLTDEHCADFRICESLGRFHVLWKDVSAPPRIEVNLPLIRVQVTRQPGLDSLQLGNPQAYRRSHDLLMEGTKFSVMTCIRLALTNAV